MALTPCIINRSQRREERAEETETIGGGGLKLETAGSERRRSGEGRRETEGDKGRETKAKGMQRRR